MALRALRRKELLKVEEYEKNVRKTKEQDSERQKMTNDIPFKLSKHVLDRKINKKKFIPARK